jgi:hypothetical protein
MYVCVPSPAAARQRCRKVLSASSPSGTGARARYAADGAHVFVCVARVRPAGHPSRQGPHPEPVLVICDVYAARARMSRRRDEQPRLRRRRENETASKTPRRRDRRPGRVTKRTRRRRRLSPETGRPTTTDNGMRRGRARRRTTIGNTTAARETPPAVPALGRSLSRPQIGLSPTCHRRRRRRRRRAISGNVATAAAVGRWTAASNARQTGCKRMEEGQRLEVTTMTASATTTERATGARDTSAASRCLA